MPITIEFRARKKNKKYNRLFHFFYYNEIMAPAKAVHSYYTKGGLYSTKLSIRMFSKFGDRFNFNNFKALSFSQLRC